MDKTNDTVTLRLLGREQPITLALPSSFASAALRWSYIVRNRDRWSASGGGPHQGEGPLAGWLTEPDRRRLAEADVVEVEVLAAADEAQDWPLRIFPWEYALSAATRAWRAQPLTVIRYLRSPYPHLPRAVDLRRPATVEAGPLPLAPWYDTRAEGELMLSCLGVSSPQPEQRLFNPNRAALGQWLAAEHPSLLHVAGVDAHQAVSLLGMEATHPPQSLLDGLALKADGSTAEVDLVPVEDLTDLLCAGQPKPDLLVLNFYNSASRTASRAVAKGARFAIGYHDVIEDGLAHIFCATLYGRLRENGGDVLDAFRAGLSALRSQPGQLRGACVVLWSGFSLIGAMHRAAASAPVAPQRGARPVAKAIGRPASRTQRKPPPAATPPDAAEATPAWQRIRVERTPRSQVNYSLLHNGQSLFRSLQIFRNQVKGPIRNIQVTVDLNAGEGAFPFQTTFDLAEGDSARDLSREVVLPLTSTLLRTQSERIQSSLRLKVSCEGQVVKEETFRIFLSPVDEWQDGEKDAWQWLPSFVLPRDPAVARVIDSAQAILCALADDPQAGFDGYQSVDLSAPRAEDRYACVDKQVQAIWYALLNTHGLSYINPPPSYGLVTQRLRTPSQLLAERRGTCIDLALLLAACLEYVDIYPVLFLLRGHAFAGYWRSTELYEDFQAMNDLAPLFEGDELPAGGQQPLGGATGDNSPGYVLGSSEHAEVRRRVFQGQLVPLEATWLTQRGPFESAMLEGRNNLRSATDFQAMIDLRMARSRGVTPIPMLGSPAP